MKEITSGQNNIQDTQAGEVAVWKLISDDEGTRATRLLEILPYIVDKLRCDSIRSHHRDTSFQTGNEKVVTNQTYREGEKCVCFVRFCFRQLVRVFDTWLLHGG